LQVTNWQRIVDKYGPVVWQSVYRLLGNHADAADCFEETFICALEVSRRQRVRNFSALLVRLATSRAIDRLRQRFSKAQLYPDAVDLVFVPSSEPWPVEQVQTLELAGQLRKALAGLSPQEAQIFCLRYLSDMSYRQIGKEFGIKTNTAGVLLHRAKTKLREFLEAAAAKEEK